MSEQIIIPSGRNPADARTANIIYILYLASFVFGVTSLIGVIIAFIYRDAAPDWVRSHYYFQIRTFWIGVVYSLAGLFSAFLLVGWLVIAFTLVWFIIRCVRGLQRLNQGQPYLNAATWLW